ncbi:MAG: hypothetical protein WCP28_11490, partial [Actinomycetes bacterium]
IYQLASGDDRRSVHAAQIPNPRSSAESAPVVGRRLNAAPSRRVPPTRRDGAEHLGLGLVEYAPVTDPIAKRARPAPPSGAAPRRVYLAPVTLPHPPDPVLPLPPSPEAVERATPRLVSSKFPGPRRAGLGPVVLRPAPPAAESPTPVSAVAAAAPPVPAAPLVPAVAAAPAAPPVSAAPPAVEPRALETQVVVPGPLVVPGPFSEPVPVPEPIPVAAPPVLRAPVEPVVPAWAHNGAFLAPLIWLVVTGTALVVAPGRSGYAFGAAAFVVLILFYLATAKYRRHAKQFRSLRERPLPTRRLT